jgi:hypothetical protein
LAGAVGMLVVKVYPQQRQVDGGGVLAVEVEVEEEEGGGEGSLCEVRGQI